MGVVVLKGFIRAGIPGALLLLEAPEADVSASVLPCRQAITYTLEVSPGKVDVYAKSKIF